MIGSTATVDTKPPEVSRILSPRDDMIDPRHPDALAHYFAVGRNAMENIYGAMRTCSKSEVKTVLDMPCGFGRVTRHLAIAFSGSDLYVCDLDPAKIEFCAREFHATAVRSKEHFNEITLPVKFDLIWCGSLLTHLNKSEFQAALRLFSRSLNQEGIAVVTTHGRYSPYIQHYKWKYLPDKQFARAEKDFRSSGFGYVDYEGQPSYGISLSLPSYVASVLEKDESIHIRGLIERGWDDHQDVTVIQKRSIHS
jgi:SAM-dependent methyltransferase